MPSHYLNQCWNINLIGPLGTNLSEIFIEICIFSSREGIWKCRLENECHLVSAQWVNTSYAIDLSKSMLVLHRKGIEHLWQCWKTCQRLVSAGAYFVTSHENRNLRSTRSQPIVSNAFKLGIYIIISENIRYLLWNRGAWRSLNNTHLTFLDPCIRCTNHLCDSSDLTDVNPHFIPSLLRKIQNVDLLWRHRYRSRPPAIVTSQWPIVPVWLLWTVI